MGSGLERAGQPGTQQEFKREAVRLLESRGERRVADVAAGLSVAEKLRHAWKKKFGGRRSR